MTEATFENRPFLHLRATYGYDLLMRLLGALWFLGLAIFTAFTMTNAINTPTSLLAKSCLVMFYLIFCLLISIRPRAKAQAYGFLPRLAAFVGTYMPWTMVFFAAPTNSALLNLMSSVCVIAGMALAIFTVLHLGKAFSLVPQARMLVRSGPYRWLRHPLYVCEEIAVFGALLQFPSPITALIFATHVGIQVCRIIYEEKLLRETFPEYREYSASTWRLIPFVW
jgi:protein-S-isoprenylcysteine O-methyltransferase Ste14